MSMTSNQQQEILRLLRAKLQNMDCDISYGGHGDFFLFRRTVNGFFRQLCLKERSALIVYYSDEYESMRKWASDNLPQVIKCFPFLNGWQLEIGNGRPQGNRAVGFRLRKENLASNADAWYSNREIVTNATVELFGILGNAGLLFNRCD